MSFAGICQYCGNAIRDEEGLVIVNGYDTHVKCFTSRLEKMCKDDLVKLKWRCYYV